MFSAAFGSNKYVNKLPEKKTASRLKVNKKFTMFKHWIKIQNPFKLGPIYSNEKPSD